MNAEPINHLRLTQAEVGCVTFEVSQCEINPLRLEMYEVFTDKVAFERHQTRVKASRWAKVSVNAECHYQIIGTESPAGGHFSEGGLRGSI